MVQNYMNIFGESPFSSNKETFTVSRSHCERDFHRLAQSLSHSLYVTKRLRYNDVSLWYSGNGGYETEVKTTCTEWKWPCVGLFKVCD